MNKMTEIQVNLSIKTEIQGKHIVYLTNASKFGNLRFYLMTVIQYIVYTGGE
jgi:hypothetical protein